VYVFFQANPAHKEYYLQEPTKNTDNTGGSALPEYRPDEKTLREFRLFGRIGITSALFSLFGIAYQAYFVLKAYNLFGKLPRTLYIQVAYFLAIIAVSITSAVLLIITSNRLLHYGNEPDNFNLYKSARQLRMWMITVLISVIINSIFYTWLFLKDRGISA
jgi:hypothetical protein